MNNFSTSYQEGEKIGERYSVVQAILGGAAEVFLCTDLVTQQPYALKSSQQRSVNLSTRYKRFCQEAEFLLALGKHPNIVRCYSIEEIDGRMFMFLEWIGHHSSKSTTLRERINHHRINQRFALDIVIDICRGLQYVNQKLPNLIHCDLKPSNILVSHEGIAKISDFGLARFAASEIYINRSSIHRLGGTNPYTAPEQWLSEGVDIRTDIYAIGCILYELFSGKRLFIANSDREYQRLHLELSIPKLANQIDLPSSVDILLERCLAKQRSDRFTSVDELLNNLVLLYKELFSELPKPRSSQSSFNAMDFANRGYAYINLQKYNLALDDCNQAINLDPQLAQGYGNLGLVYVNTEDYSKAISSLSRAIELDDSDVLYYANRALSYLQIGAYSQAISDYSEAIQRDPMNIPLRLNRAYVYFYLDQLDKALDEYNQILKIDSNNVEVYIFRGELHHRLKNFQEAIFGYTKAIEKNPKVARGYQYRGLSYKEIGEYERSLADYNIAIGLDQENPNLFHDRAIVYEYLNNYRQSLMDYSNSIKLDSSHFEAFYRRGNIYERIGLFEQSLADYEEATKINPSYGLAYFSMGKLLNRMERLSEAIICFKSAQQLGIISI